MKRSSTALTWLAKPWVVLTIAALAAVGFYLIVSELIFQVGFPLDDSWIHLTYARNLAEHGEWAFRLGQRSAGSTAPLWTILLALGFLLGLGPYIWAFLLGAIVLALVGIYAEQVARRVVATYQPSIPWAGLFFVFAWHLTWSASSGMETLLHGLIILVVLGTLITGPRHYLTLGVLVGLSTWVRPDGLTLLGPVLFVAVLAEPSWQLRSRAIGNFVLGFGSLFVPYLLFNLAISGNPLPNTFYAKQAEYEAYWLSRTLGDRIGEYLWPLLAGPFVVLVPAAVWWLLKNIRAQNWGVLASVLWFFGYIAIYFVRLPAYQHGRYIIPALPIMYLWGMLGFLELVLSARLHARWVVLWQMTLVVLILAFQFMGARQNAYDVFWIESEMVLTAKWVQQNVPPDARLAVHDIGAIGYYASNPLVDMAGLITPDVIPFIRDEARLEEYLDANAVDYLVSFPSLYPALTSQRESLFEAGMKLDSVDFEENMHVFRWK